MIRILALLLVALAGNVAELCSRSNTINQLFFHKGNLADKLVFYMAQKPQIQEVSAKKKVPGQTIVLQLVNTKFAEDFSKERVEYINKRFEAQKQPYSIALYASEQQQIPTVQLSFTWDPNVIICKQDFFKSIKGEEGLIFTFIQKKVLERYERDKRYTIIKQRIPRVVIDVGHGGRDMGAVGFDNAVEKNITAQVGAKVAQILTDQGFKVFLTRTSDVYVPLDERTSLSNLIAQADFFISIHANSSPDEKTQGIETYFFEPALLKNSHVCGSLAVDTALIESVQKQVKDESKRLATTLHDKVMRTVRDLYPTMPDRTVKTAVSQVLLGTEAPAVLIEIGFVTNKDEARRLTNEKYQLLLAKGISEGITTFAEGLYQRPSQCALKVPGQLCVRG